MSQEFVCDLRAYIPINRRSRKSNGGRGVNYETVLRADPGTWYRARVVPDKTMIFDWWHPSDNRLNRYHPRPPSQTNVVRIQSCLPECAPKPALRITSFAFESKLTKAFVRTQPGEPGFA